jgi:hypothetical protein
MPRKPKFEDAPAAGQASLAMPDPGYVASSDMAHLLAACIADYPEKLGHLRDVTFATLSRTSTNAEDSFSVDGSGGGWIRAPKERAIYGLADAGVWMRSKWWDKLSPTQRRAWMFHQLSHFQINPNGTLRRVGHDVEAFADEALIFGTWDDGQLALFSQNLDRHGAPVAKAAPKPKAEPASGFGPDLDDTGHVKPALVQ